MSTGRDVVPARPEIVSEPLSGSETLDPAARAGTHARGSGPPGRPKTSAIGGPPSGSIS